MFRQKEKGVLRAGLHTMGAPVAEIAFKGRLHFFVKEDRSEGTRDDTLLAGDALFLIDVVDAILGHDGSGWAVLHAFGYLALPADDGHPDDGMGVDHHDANGALLGVVHPKALNGTDQFAKLTSGTSFCDHCQLPGHVFLLIVLTVKSVWIVHFVNGLKGDNNHLVPEDLSEQNGLNHHNVLIGFSQYLLKSFEGHTNIFTRHIQVGHRADLCLADRIHQNALFLHCCHYLGSSQLAT